MGNWQWWAGRDEEYFTSGPFTSRDWAIAQGQNDFCDDDTFLICEAQSHDLNLSAERLLDDQYFEDSEMFDYDNAEPEWRCPPEARKVASAALQAALDQWVAEFGHCLNTPNMFANVRNHETVEVKHDD